MEPFTFFISYRREDTAPIALLLKYEIEKRLEFVRVLVDVEEIRHGEVFPDRIRNLIDKAHATIVLVGGSWMPGRGAPQPSPGAAGAIVNTDWIVTELQHSIATLPAYDQENLYGLRERRILPISVGCEPDFEQFKLPAAIARLADTHSESIRYASWPREIGKLVENIALQLGLEKRPDNDEYPKPDWAKARTQPVQDQALAEILKYQDYDGWYVDNFGDTDVRYLTKTFKFRNFTEASDFMKLIIDHCRVLDHHPEWRNVFNHVTVSLTTWDARRHVTIYDLNLALFMNKAATVVLNRR